MRNFRTLQVILFMPNVVIKREMSFTPRMLADE